VNNEGLSAVELAELKAIARERAEKSDREGADVRDQWTSGEPILWLESNASAYIYRDREQPDLAHVGSYDNKRVHPRAMDRYLFKGHAVNHIGNILRVPLTNGPADLDTTSPYAQAQIGQARALGWYPAFGECLIRVVKQGWQPKSTLVVEEHASPKAKMCKHVPPGKMCPHAEAEMLARRAVHNEAMAQLEQKYKSETAKHQERVDAAKDRELGDLKASIAATNNTIRELAEALKPKQPEAPAKKGSK
jgi:hypothetical protein